ncbi:hypothetical protein LWI28_012014 [Acer negundo]|uniref:Uncharacterized protein n=1 Tax=Acer negundo TaxID=4023 RepID=A0AAD5JTG9_ACENE|nr:hypothetical protein LWI28_012014 [Acer negundo]
MEEGRVEMVEKEMEEKHIESGGEERESEEGNEIKCSGGKKWEIYVEGANKAGENNVTVHTVLKKRKVQNLCVSVKRRIMKTRYSNVNFKVSWNLEDGISKIIETIVNLGFDFKGNSVNMADIMAELKRKLKLVGVLVVMKRF